MAAVISDIYLTVLICWAIMAITAVGVVVLPWTRHQLEQAHSAWLHVAELFVGRAQGLTVRAPAPVNEVPDLPELTWELTGDWTTAPG
jgi:hypothetical protein